MSREMVNERWAQFKANTKAFFKSPEGAWNRQAIIAILIAGFAGWLLLTVTVGARIKRALKKVPGVKMLFGSAKRTYTRARRAMPRRKRK
jgi:uncharacterized membrane protein